MIIVNLINIKSLKFFYNLFISVNKSALYTYTLHKGSLMATMLKYSKMCFKIPVYTYSKQYNTSNQFYYVLKLSRISEQNFETIRPKCDFYFYFKFFKFFLDIYFVIELPKLFHTITLRSKGKKNWKKNHGAFRSRS